jgi:hypothetical protein
MPKGSGDAELVPEGSGELETTSVRPDWPTTTLMIVPDGLRLMSFNSCLMGTIILVPNGTIVHLCRVLKPKVPWDGTIWLFLLSIPMVL